MVQYSSTIKFLLRPTIKGPSRNIRNYSTSNIDRKKFPLSSNLSRHNELDLDKINSQSFHSTAILEPSKRFNEKMYCDEGNYGSKEEYCPLHSQPCKFYLEDGIHHYVIYEDDPCEDDQREYDLYDDENYWSSKPSHT
jgi:hypothetical protein